MNQMEQNMTVPNTQKTLNFKFMGYNIKAFDEEFDGLFANCSACEHKRDVIYSMKEIMAELVKQVYIEGDYNPEYFEQLIDDMCHCLQIKSMYGTMQIESKNKKQAEIKQKCA
jgi:hypothetical protein